MGGKMRCCGQDAINLVALVVPTIGNRTGTALINDHLPRRSRADLRRARQPVGCGVFGGDGRGEPRDTRRSPSWLGRLPQSDADECDHHREREGCVQVRVHH